jgi:hypothetical protein
LHHCAQAGATDSTTLADFLAQLLGEPLASLQIYHLKQRGVWQIKSRQYQTRTAHLVAGKRLYFM